MSEDRVFAKCAWRLVPFMALLYVANFIDRTNVGFAALTMNRDLGFSPAVYGFGAGILFLSYMLGQVPANLILVRLGTRRWMFCILLAWGAISAGTAFVRSADEFYALRFLLGAAEAGFFPGMIFYLTLWFPQAYRTRFSSWFVAAVPVSAIIGGPLSGLILGMDGIGGLKGWQWLFLLEGIPSSLLAFAALRLLPDSPAQATWLTSEEKDTIASRLAAETAAANPDLWQAFRDPRVLALALAGVTHGAALYGTALWVPQMVQAMGYSNLVTGFVVAGLYLVCMVIIVAWGYSSDRNAERIWHIMGAWLLSGAGCVIASVAPADAMVLLGLTLAVSGIQSAISPLFALPSTFLRGAAAAGAIAFLNTTVSLGGFFGPTLIGVLREETGSYTPGLIMLAGGLLLSIAIVRVLARTMAMRRAVASG